MCTGSEFLMAATAFNAITSVQQGREAKQYYDYQAAQAEADAQAEREAGQVTAAKVRRAGRLQQSEATAALAAGGVEVGAGTPQKINQYLERANEEDALQQILLGERKGARLDQQAGLDRLAGQRAETAGRRNAVGSVLMAGAQTYKPGWQAPAPVEERSIGATRIR